MGCGPAMNSFGVCDAMGDVIQEEELIQVYSLMMHALQKGPKVISDFCRKERAPCSDREVSAFLESRQAEN